MLSTVHPPKLLAARTAFAAAAVTVSTALCAGVVAPYAGQVLRPHVDAVELASEIREITANVELLALKQPVGIYTTGSLFEVLGKFGLGDPVSALNTIVSAINVPVLSQAVSGLISALDEFGPVDTGLVQGSDIFNRINGLGYSSDAMADLIGILPSNPLYAAIKDAAGPMINQRRGLLVADHFGGTEAARALRTMIDAVSAGSASWGGDPNKPGYVNPGVTGVVSLLLRNPSRPGGGLLGLFNQPGLMNPDAGTYLSPDKKQALNVSYTDVGFKYDILSDIPSTFGNPLAWLNTVMGAAFPTYLIPDRDYVGQAVADLIPGALAGAIDGATATLDPSGGQGLSLVPVVGPFLDALRLLAPQLVDPFLRLFEKPGNATYLTWDSGNLALLEPLAVVPRLLSYVLNTDIPNPLVDTLQAVLQPLVDSGYQDAKIVYGDDGVPAIVRTGDMAGVSPNMLRSPLSAVDSLQLPQIVANALVRGINENLLSPENFHLNLGGINLSGMINNALVIGVAHAIRDVLEKVRVAANPAFDAMEAALAPVALKLDQLAGGGAASGASLPVSTSPSAAVGSAAAVPALSAPVDGVAAAGDVTTVASSPAADAPGGSGASAGGSRLGERGPSAAQTVASPAAAVVDSGIPDGAGAAAAGGNSGGAGVSAALGTGSAPAAPDPAEAPGRLEGPAPVERGAAPGVARAAGVDRSERAAVGGGGRGQGGSGAGSRAGHR